MTTAADVVAAARGHLLTPWQHQGRVPGLALDCAGLLICVARQLGLVAPDFDINGYARVPDGTMPDWCDRYLEPVSDPQYGGVLMCAISQDPQHLGIVGDYLHGGLSIIHASSSAGKVVETRLMWARNQRLVRAYRFPGVAA